ncbi:MAG TPA: GNAT family N-acetyltransferase [Bryobacteraceae bacterium]
MMTLPAWHEEPISKKHDRKSFDCGDPFMNDFLQRYARQSHESGAAKTFLAIDNNKTILGSYSLAPGALAYADTRETLRRGLARHDVPGFRLARIATDLQRQGQGLGGQLLAAAARRCLRAAAEVGGVVLIIDAKNDRAAGWYASYGAVALSNRPLSAESAHNAARRGGELGIPVSARTRAGRCALTLVMSLATFATDLQAAGQL